MNDKIPKFVYPCGKKFRVKQEHMDTDLYGETEGSEKTIKINTDPKKKKSHLQTLFHEYVHGIWYVTGISALLEDKGELEEAMTIAMEEHLFHMIDTTMLSKKP
jgi:hypothetical protein